MGDIEILGVDGSYAYMVSSNGTMLYHKTAEKIGKPVENAAVKGIVAELAVGNKVENGSIIYQKLLTKLNSNSDISFFEAAEAMATVKAYCNSENRQPSTIIISDTSIDS